MKYRNYILVLLIVIFSCLFYLYVYKSEKKEEGFENSDNIGCYVITLKKPEKMKNIEEQQKKCKYNIEIVDAIFGDDLNMNELVKEKKVDANYVHGHPRQIGCYMSHMKIWDMIQEKQKNDSTKYSIIFEDDFNLVDDFNQRLKDILQDVEDKNIEFDMIILGNLLGAGGELISKDVYKKQYFYGTHGCLIKNDNIDRLKNAMKFIDNNFDLKLNDMNTEGKINVHVVTPALANQLRDKFDSDIGL